MKRLRGNAVGATVAVSEALQDLVGRLSARLHEEAEAAVSVARERFQAQLHGRIAGISGMFNGVLLPSPATSPGGFFSCWPGLTEGARIWRWCPVRTRHAPISRCRVVGGLRAADGVDLCRARRGRRDGRANLQAALQNPSLLGAFAAVFVVLALSLFGAFELQLPSWLGNRLDRAGRHQRGGTLAGAAVLGFLSALLVGPCMTAPLAGALLYISQSGSALTGGLALFALGVGMGLPLLAIAVFGARILPRPGAWMDRVKEVFGYVLFLATSCWRWRFRCWRCGAPGCSAWRRVSWPWSHRPAAARFACGCRATSQPHRRSWRLRS